MLFVLFTVELEDIQFCFCCTCLENELKRFSEITPTISSGSDCRK